MDASKPRIRMTSDEYLALPDDGKQYELHDGILVEKDAPYYDSQGHLMPAPSPLHGWIVMLLVRAISNFVLERALGYVAGDNVDYFLADGVILKPDVGFVAGRYPPIPKRFTIAPTLAIEVLSPSNTPAEMRYKINTYFQYGSRLVWIIDPEQKEVAVYRKDNEGHLTAIFLTTQDMLTGDEVLPGFTLAIAGLFPDETTTQDSPI